MLTYGWRRSHSLTEKFTGVFRALSGKGKISEENIRDSMREVRTALLEADVNFKVVKDFTEAVVQKVLRISVLSKHCIHAKIAVGLCKGILSLTNAHLSFQQCRQKKVGLKYERWEHLVSSWDFINGFRATILINCRSFYLSKHQFIRWVFLFVVKGT